MKSSVDELHDFLAGELSACVGQASSDSFTNLFSFVQKHESDSRVWSFLALSSTISLSHLSVICSIFEQFSSQQISEMIDPVVLAFMRKFFALEFKNLKLTKPEKIVDCLSAAELLNHVRFLFFKKSRLNTTRMEVEESEAEQCLQILKNNFVLFITGPALSGKTTLAKGLVSEIEQSSGKKAEINRILVDSSSDPVSLLGSHSLSQDTSSRIFDFKFGPLFKAIKEGNVLILDNFELASFALSSFIGQMLIARKVHIQGKSAHFHKDFRLIIVSRSLPDSLYEKNSTLHLSEVNFLPSKLPKTSTIHKVFELALLCKQNDYELKNFFSRVQAKFSANESEFSLVSKKEQLAMDFRDLFFKSKNNLLFESEIFDPLCEALGINQAELKLRLSSYVPELRKKPLPNQKFALINSRLSNQLVIEHSTSPGYLETATSAQLIENILAAMERDEHPLLVGETGCGKTAVVQHLAYIFGKKLKVINLSRSSDSSDLFGAFRPKTLDTPLSLITTFRTILKLLKIDQANKNLADNLEKKLNDDFVNGRKVLVSQLSSLQKYAEANKEFDLISSSYFSLIKRAKNTSGFEFLAGVLSDALENDCWVLLDEVNLASEQTLMRIHQILIEKEVALCDSGEFRLQKRSPDSRVFAAMNPGVEAGKKPLPARMKEAFVEFFCESVSTKEEFEELLNKKFSGSMILAKEELSNFAQLFEQLRKKAQAAELLGREERKMAFSLRQLSLCARLLRNAFTHPAMRVERKAGIYTAARIALELPLCPLSRESFKEIYASVFSEVPANYFNTDFSRPFAASGYVEVFNHAIKAGSFVDPTQESPFILTDTTKEILNDVLKIVSLESDTPLLLEGPTALGKTAMINFIARRAMKKLTRLNNHRDTSIEEYVGRYSPDECGRLTFKEGPLITAMREGSWLLLDELNLAKSEILEALNRVLDDNRELLVPELDEVIRPAEGFRIFATQNPASYSGRSTLSQAFLNRFIMVPFDSLTSNDFAKILTERGAIPESRSQIMIKVKNKLESLRSEEHSLLGKSALVSLRDLLKWARRVQHSVEVSHVVLEGVSILAERIRQPGLKNEIVSLICKESKIKNFDLSHEYSAAFDMIAQEIPIVEVAKEMNFCLDSHAKRAITLTYNAIKNHEPVLLVGEPGCGKTTISQVLSKALKVEFRSFSCHRNTEASDFLGNFRPIRIEKKSKLIECLIHFGLFQVNGNNSITANHARIKDIEPSLSSEEKEGLQEATSWLPFGLDKVTPSQANFSLELLKFELAEARAKFEWAPGSLITLLQTGGVFLLDEISLAKDSVLERLNSLLESDRSIYLHEQDPPALINADDRFYLIATMNPSGDHGKRELSDALRSRMTEIWVTSALDAETFSSEKGQAELRQFVRGIASSVKGDSSDETVETLCRLIELVNKSQNDVFKAINTRDIQQLARVSSKTSVHYAFEQLFSMMVCNLDPQAQNFAAKILEDFREASPLLKSQDETQAPKFEEGKLKFFSYWLGSENSLLPSDYVLDDPTILANAGQILVGLQTERALLLEGPPGIGKSSLVRHLAMLAGVPLFCINLSAQTELYDLLGSDVPDQLRPGRFLWIDGPLVQALKQGGWLLIDELNLASQTVLEGLNALLDHRQEVYLPDVDLVVRKTKGFQIFATQNPLSTEGRKGLPQSFLSRFYRIYLAQTSQEAVARISNALISNQPPVIKSLIQQKNLNLRLLKRATKFLKAYGKAIEQFPRLTATVLDEFISVDQEETKTSAKLSQDSQQSFSFFADSEGSLPLIDLPYNPSNPSVIFRPEEFWKIMLCVHHRATTAIKVEPHRKRVLISHLKYLAQCSDKVLRHAFLNKSSDITDLVGSYDLVDVPTLLKSKMKSFKYLISPQLEGKILSSAKLSREELNQLPEDFAHYIENLDVSKPIFGWSDSEIIKAADKGDWLVIEGVTECQAAILERLNGLFDGERELILSECFDEHNKLRRIEVKDGFRVFLLIGEETELRMSNALRNRCVIIDWPSARKNEEIDQQTVQLLRDLAFLKKGNLDIDLANVDFEDLTSPNFANSIAEIRNSFFFDVHHGQLDLSSMMGKLEHSEVLPFDSISKAIRFFTAQQLIKFVSGSNSQQTLNEDWIELLNKPTSDSSISTIACYPSLQVKFQDFIHKAVEIIKAQLFLYPIDTSLLKSASQSALSTFFSQSFATKLSIHIHKNPQEISKLVHSLHLIRDTCNQLNYRLLNSSAIFSNFLVSIESLISNLVKSTETSLAKMIDTPMFVKFESDEQIFNIMIPFVEPIEACFLNMNIINLTEIEKIFEGIEKNVNCIYPFSRVFRMIEKLKKITSLKQLGVSGLDMKKVESYTFYRSAKGLIESEKSELKLIDMIFIPVFANIIKLEIEKNRDSREVTPVIRATIDSRNDSDSFIESEFKEMLNLENQRIGILKQCSEKDYWNHEEFKESETLLTKITLRTEAIQESIISSPVRFINFTCEEEIEPNTFSEKIYIDNKKLIENRNFVMKPIHYKENDLERNIETIFSAFSSTKAIFAPEYYLDQIHKMVRSMNSEANMNTITPYSGDNISMKVAFAENPHDALKEGIVEEYLSMEKLAKKFEEKNKTLEERMKSKTKDEYVKVKKPVVAKEEDPEVLEVEQFMIKKCAKIMWMLCAEAGLITPIGLRIKPDPIETILFVCSQNEYNCQPLAKKLFLDLLSQYPRLSRSDWDLFELTKQTPRSLFGNTLTKFIDKIKSVDRGAVYDLPLEDIGLFSVIGGIVKNVMIEAQELPDSALKNYTFVACEKLLNVPTDSKTTEVLLAIDLLLKALEDLCSITPREMRKKLDEEKEKLLEIVFNLRKKECKSWQKILDYKRFVYLCEKISVTMNETISLMTSTGEDKLDLFIEFGENSLIGDLDLRAIIMRVVAGYSKDDRLKGILEFQGYKNFELKEKVSSLFHESDKHMQDAQKILNWKLRDYQILQHNSEKYRGVLERTFEKEREVLEKGFNDMVLFPKRQELVFESADAIYKALSAHMVKDGPAKHPLKGSYIAKLSLKIAEKTGKKEDMSFFRLVSLKRLAELRSVPHKDFKKVASFDTPKTDIKNLIEMLMERLNTIKENSPTKMKEVALRDCLEALELFKYPNRVPSRVFDERNILSQLSFVTSTNKLFTGKIDMMSKRKCRVADLLRSLSDFSKHTKTIDRSILDKMLSLLYQVFKLENKLSAEVEKMAQAIEVKSESDEEKAARKKLGLLMMFEGRTNADATLEEVMSMKSKLLEKYPESIQLFEIIEREELEAKKPTEANITSFKKRLRMIELHRTASPIAKFSSILDIFKKCNLYSDYSLSFGVSYLYNLNKLLYLLSIVFNSIILNGFCKKKDEQEEIEGEEEMNLGTGVGEGKGEKDVTGELEFEEQVMGNKGDKEDNDEREEQGKSEDEFDVNGDIQNNVEKEEKDEEDKEEEEEIDEDKLDDKMSEVSQEDIDPDMYREDKPEGEEPQAREEEAMELEEGEKEFSDLEAEAEEEKSKEMRKRDEDKSETISEISEKEGEQDLEKEEEGEGEDSQKDSKDENEMEIEEEEKVGSEINYSEQPEEPEEIPEKEKSQDEKEEPQPENAEQTKMEEEKEEQNAGNMVQKQGEEAQDNAAGDDQGDPAQNKEEQMKQLQKLLEPSAAMDPKALQEMLEKLNQNMDKDLPPDLTEQPSAFAPEISEDPNADRTKAKNPQPSVSRDIPNQPPPVQKPQMPKSQNPNATMPDLLEKRDAETVPQNETTRVKPKLNSLQKDNVDFSKIVLEKGQEDGSYIEFTMRRELKNHSRNLAETLRHILDQKDPSCLVGDFRSGKRLNLKKLLPYIASDYKKDKIWLRRVEPEEPTYRILLAIDDSASMTHKNVGKAALESLFVLADALVEAKAGEVFISPIGASFKAIQCNSRNWNNKKHDEIMSSFTFAYDSPNSADYSMPKFISEASDFFTGFKDSFSNICFLVSDGRVNKDLIRPILAQAEDKGYTFFFIILDHGQDSILNYRTLTQAPDGSIALKEFLSDFPFRYYIIVREVETLADKLGKILAEYFGKSLHG